MSETKLCECCKKNPSVGVASIPGIPMSIAWCTECLAAQVIPIWALSANTACAGGLEQSADWWKELVERTLKYFNKSLEEFNSLVAEDQKTLDAYYMNNRV
jgi:hypothetical protein